MQVLYSSCMLRAFVTTENPLQNQESILVAGSNAFLLTADPASFQLYREQTGDLKCAHSLST